ncbi:phycobilisome linker polypeptide [Phormidium sp. CCY1219]|jgi:sulfite reductase alpha subunit-like flavoprotein|uniref:phycobilisome linker polypeptide n=1 Tax=Phormidium sp. CCY1219 TaxID=2886104 RepID=UPI002D1F6AA8|nr:phycobilisome linker polypeptide [Phormidium sp. CCY1219]MEB3831775.1 phycobilisome linker polypeptide [Phormidium sp. CCY1219]
MLGQIAGGSNANTQAGNRYFRYEVTGLHEGEDTDKMNYSIRKSGSVFMTVPYNRMNEEMQRITRMGGKIVNIEPVNFNPEAQNQ